MKKLLNAAAVGAILMTTTACSQLMDSPFQDMEESDQWDSAAADQIDDRLSDSAERASDASETLAQIERTRTAPVEESLDGNGIDGMPPELQRPTTVEWTGPAPDLVNELARNIGYDYAIVGTTPPVDVMVSVSAVDTPAIKVFEDIGYQVSKFAEVFVDPNGKRIEFRFLTDDHAEDEGMPMPQQQPTPKADNEISAPRLSSTPDSEPRSVRRAKDKLGK